MFTMGPPLWGSGDGGVDPYCSYVRTLLHFDDTTTADAAVPPLVWSDLSSVALTTEYKQFGSSSLDCRNSTSDGLVGPASDSLALGTGDFCIEAWFNDPGEPGANQWWFNCIGSVDSIGIWTLSGGTFVPNGGGASGLSGQSYFGLVWMHIAIVRSGNTMYCYFNGSESHSWDCTGWNHGTGIATFYLGRSSGGGSGKLLMIDEFRVTVGVPRYTGPFIPEGPFPAGCAAGSTGLLLPYTIDFDFPDNTGIAAVKAHYLLDGVVITAEETSPDSFWVHSCWGGTTTCGFNGPSFPASGEPEAKYLLGIADLVTPPLELVIELPPGTNCRNVRYDFGMSDGLASCTATFSDLSEQSEILSPTPEAAWSMSQYAFTSLGSEVLTKITWRFVDPTYLKALTNIVFSE